MICTMRWAALLLFAFVNISSNDVIACRKNGERVMILICHPICHGVRISHSINRTMTFSYVTNCVTNEKAEDWAR